MTTTPDLQTLSDFLDSQRPHVAELDQGLDQVLTAVLAASRQISYDLQQGALAGILGSADTDNVQGEVQKKLDIIANDSLIDALKRCEPVAGMASEENDDCIANNPAGRYLVLFDPLDGSSNIDVNMSVGTIFSILPVTQTPVTKESFFQPGSRQIAAGYVLYGPATLLVLTLGNGVNVFTLDRDQGEFYLTASQLQIPADTQEFAINMSNQRHWEAPVQRYISECLAGKTGERGKDFNMRWVASMVGDVHRILSRGGIFMYPYDLKDPKKAGRLRLMYEANPMSFLIEQAGGQATTGRQRILDVQPNDLHQRIPVMLGSAVEVRLVTSYHG